MGYSYEEELGMYMDDDGHMLTEDMLPEDMQERLRMQRQADLEHEMALEEYETNKRYYEKIRNAYLAGDKEGIIKYAEHEIHSQYEFECGYSDKERKESLEAIEKAGELGYMPAIEYLVWVYYDGMQECLAPDFKKFLYWAEKGKLSDNPQFLSSLGDRYLEVYKKGYESQYKNKAIEVYQKAVDLGSSSAMYSMYEMGIKGYLHEATRIEPPAIPMSQMSAEEKFLYDGTPTYIMNTQKYNEKAFEYLIKAAESGEYKYLNTLGLEYLKGRICEKNENAAFKCFEKVVDEFNKKDLFGLNSILGLTININDIDEDDEYTEYTNGVYLEHLPAVYNLAYCYENGIGCEVDKKKAFKLYSTVKKQSRYANLKVAYCYENGIGCEANKEKAFRMYKALAKDMIMYNEDYIAEPF